MRHYLATLHDHLVDMWSHRLTAFLGLSIGTVSPYLTVLNQLLATVTLLMGLYFSWKKGTRETAITNGDRTPR